MKIVFVTECLGSGGAERQMVNLAIMMKNYGHSVHVLTWDSRDFCTCIYNHRTTKTNQKYPSVNL